MSDQPAPGAKVVAVPGPSLTTEGIVRSTISTVRAAIEGLQGAAAAARSLGR